MGLRTDWRGPGASHLTEEHEHAHVQLQQPGHSERPPLGAAQRVEQQLAAQRPLPLLGPHVDLLLAVRKRAVLPVLALLALLHLCSSPRGGDQLISSFSFKYDRKKLRTSAGLCPLL